MKFSFLTYLFCRFPLEYSFKMAQAYGFEGIEIWGARPQAYAFDLGKKECGEIVRMQKKYSVEVSMYTPELLAYPYNLASVNKKERKDTLNYLKQSLEVCARINTQRMLLTLPHPGFLVPKKQAIDWAREGMIELAERADELGVSIVLETLSPSESNLLTTADDAFEFIDEIGSKSVTLMLDLVPPLIANEPFSVYLENEKVSVDYMHVTNSDGKTEFHAAFNEGVLPMEAVFTVLNRCGFSGWCSLELLNPYFKDPELYLADSISKIRSYIQ